MTSLGVSKKQACNTSPACVANSRIRVGGQDDDTMSFSIHRSRYSVERREWLTLLATNQVLA